jgi:hypothetical protein
LAIPDAVAIRENRPIFACSVNVAAKHFGSWLARWMPLFARAFASNLKVIQLLPDSSRRVITMHLRDNTDRDGKQRKDVDGCAAQEVIEMNGEHKVPLAYHGVSMLSTY